VIEIEIEIDTPIHGDRKRDICGGGDGGDGDT